MFFGAGTGANQILALEWPAVSRCSDSGGPDFQYLACAVSIPEVKLGSCNARAETVDAGHSLSWLQELGSTHTCPSSEIFNCFFAS